MSKKELHSEALFFNMKGKILISSPSLLTDMIFYKSIILIVDQTDEGVTGFILNRPSDLFMTKEVKYSEKIKIDLYYGGPVSSEYFYLLRSEKIHKEILNVYDNLFWGNNLDFLINQIEKGIVKMNDFILFQGYSGWGLKQLDNEIANDSWIITEKKVEDVFSFKKKNSWNNLIKEFGHKYRLWSNSPDDITLN
jgi:putative transcriptional regulator